MTLVSCKDGFNRELQDEEDIINKAVKISFSSFGNDDFDFSSFGSIISRCKLIREIWFSNGELTEEIATALFQADGPYSFNLMALAIQGCGGRAGLKSFLSLLSYLRSQGELFNLYLNRSCMGNEGARTIAELMNDVRVIELDIRKNRLTGEGLSAIFSSRNAKHLKKIELEEFELCIHGIDEVVDSLRKGDISLRELEFSCPLPRVGDSVDIGCIDTVLRSLWKNETVKALVFHPEFRVERLNDNEKKRILVQVTKAAKKLVCNTTTFKDFCQSNHTLHHLVLVHRDFQMDSLIHSLVMSECCPQPQFFGNHPALMICLTEPRGNNVSQALRLHSKLTLGVISLQTENSASSSSQSTSGKTLPWTHSIP